MPKWEQHYEYKTTDLLFMASWKTSLLKNLWLVMQRVESLNSALFSPLFALSLIAFHKWREVEPWKCTTMKMKWVWIFRKRTSWSKGMMSSQHQQPKNCSTHDAPNKYNTDSLFSVLSQDVRFPLIRTSALSWVLASCPSIICWRLILCWTQRWATARAWVLWLVCCCYIWAKKMPSKCLNSSCMTWGCGNSTGLIWSYCR